jgi:hypothetical protein
MTMARFESIGFLTDTRDHSGLPSGSRTKVSARELGLRATQCTTIGKGTGAEYLLSD